MKTIKIKFKVIKLLEKSGECEALLKSGKKVIIDPFVGCAFEYKDREELLDKWYKADGFWCRDVFLPEEGTMELSNIN